MFYSVVLYCLNGYAKAYSYVERKIELLEGVNEDRTKVSEIAAKVKKQLEELRSMSEEQTLIPETDNPTSSLTQEIEQPSPQSGGNVVAPTDAKINNKLKSSKD